MEDGAHVEVASDDALSSSSSSSSSQSSLQPSPLSLLIDSVGVSSDEEFPSP